MQQQEQIRHASVDDVNNATGVNGSSSLGIGLTGNLTGLSTNGSGRSLIASSAAAAEPEIARGSANDGRIFAVIRSSGDASASTPLTPSPLTLFTLTIAVISVVTLCVHLYTSVAFAINGSNSDAGNNGYGNDLWWYGVTESLPLDPRPPGTYNENGELVSVLSKVESDIADGKSIGGVAFAWQQRDRKPYYPYLTRIHADNMVSDETVGPRSHVVTTLHANVDTATSTNTARASSGNSNTNAETDDSDSLVAVSRVSLPRSIGHNEGDFGYVPFISALTSTSGLQYYVPRHHTARVCARNNPTAASSTASAAAARLRRWSRLHNHTHGRYGTDTSDRGDRDRSSTSNASDKDDDSWAAAACAPKSDVSKDLYYDRYIDDGLTLEESVYSDDDDESDTVAGVTNLNSNITSRSNNDANTNATTISGSHKPEENASAARVTATVSASVNGSNPAETRTTGPFAGDLTSNTADASRASAGAAPTETATTVTTTVTESNTVANATDANNSTATTTTTTTTATEVARRRARFVAPTFEVPTVSVASLEHWAHIPSLKPRADVTEVPVRFENERNQTSMFILSTNRLQQ